MVGGGGGGSVYLCVRKRVCVKYKWYTDIAALSIL